MSTDEGYTKLAGNGALGAGPFCKRLGDLVPIVSWLPEYSVKEDLLVDVIASLTLGCILMSQSMAHAALSGVQLIHGPYSCILPPIIYSIFGTSIQGSVGTASLLALLTGSFLADYGDIEERTRVACVLSLLVGVALMIMGLCRLSFLVRFLSRPALSGFMTASAIIIMLAMAGPMFGLPARLKKYGNVLEILVMHTAELEHWNLATAGISAVGLAFLMGAKSLSKLHSSLEFVSRFKDMIFLVCAALFTFVYGKDQGVAIIGTVSSQLPAFSVPFRPGDAQLVKELLPGALMLALIAFISSFAPAKKMALKEGYQIGPVSELMAIGMANVCGSFNGALPCAIGLSRVSIAHALGVRSQLGSNFFVGVFMACSVMFMSPVFYYIPKCALNTIIFNGVISLLEFNTLYWLYSLHVGRKERKDLLVWVAAFVCTLGFGAIKGILLSGVFSMILIVYDVVEPSIDILGRLDENGHWVNTKIFEEAEQHAGVLVVRLSGPIFYANAEHLQQTVEDLELAAAEAGNPLEAIILVATPVSFIDATALEVLEELIQSTKSRGLSFFISGAHGNARLLIKQVLGELLANENLHSSIDSCVQQFQDLKNKKNQRVRPIRRASEYIDSSFERQLSNSSTVSARGSFLGASL